MHVTNELHMRVKTSFKETYHIIALTINPTILYLIASSRAANDGIETNCSLFYLTITTFLLNIKTLMFLVYSFEPRHDKTNKMAVRPVKTQISLGIRLV